MTAQTELASTTLTQRLVLLSLARLTERDESPAKSVQVRDCCGDHLDDVAAEVLGSPSEVDVSHALNELEDAGLVGAVRADETSAVGKGRPEYELTVDVESVLDGFADDDRVAPLIEQIRESRS